jgi:hypothetical protein
MPAIGGISRGEGSNDGVILSHRPNERKKDLMNGLNGIATVADVTAPEQVGDHIRSIVSGALRYRSLGLFFVH